jgi:hypothetical protein
VPGSASPPVRYWKLRKGSPPFAAGRLPTGFVQETSVVRMRAASVAPGPGMMAAVQTSFGDRNKLKSRTSDEVLPSRIRTLTAFARLVVLTTERYVFQDALAAC